MQAAEDVFTRSRMVVLHKLILDPERRQHFLVVAFKKESPRVTEYLGLQQEDIRDRCAYSFQNRALFRPCSCQPALLVLRRAQDDRLYRSGVHLDTDGALDEFE